MEISIVIPTYNGRQTVTRVLETLFAQRLAPERFEIVVVVDGSDDGTAEALKKLHPDCRLRIVEQENRGLAGARNTGYRAAATDLILFLDDDMLCDPGLVQAHLEAHESAAPVAAFGAIFLSEDSPPSLAAECFRREIGLNHLKRKSNPDLAWELKECVFSNTSLRRSDLEAAGGFDESFRMREDLEFGIRLFATGVRPLALPAAIAYQHYDKTSRDLIHDARMFAQADLQILQKHPDAITQVHLYEMNIKTRWGAAGRKAATLAPHAPDLALRLMCAFGEMLYGVRPVRNFGVRALQRRRRLHWLRQIRKVRSSARGYVPAKEPAQGG